MVPHAVLKVSALVAFVGIFLGSKPVRPACAEVSGFRMLAKGKAELSHGSDGNSNKHEDESPELEAKSINSSLSSATRQTGVDSTEQNVSESDESKAMRQKVLGEIPEHHVAACLLMKLVFESRFESQLKAVPQITAHRDELKLKAVSRQKNTQSAQEENTSQNMESKRESLKRRILESPKLDSWLCSNEASALDEWYAAKVEEHRAAAKQASDKQVSDKQVSEQRSNIISKSSQSKTLGSNYTGQSQKRKEDLNQKNQQQMKVKNSGGRITSSEAEKIRRNYEAKGNPITITYIIEVILQALDYSGRRQLNEDNTRSSWNSTN
jgi:hypothetical protein